MNPIVVFVMVAQVIIFLAWAFVAFRTLFRLNSVAMDRRVAEGLGPIGMSQTIATFADFARGRILPGDRSQLLLLTLAMIVMLALRASF